MSSDKKSYSTILNFYLFSEKLKSQWTGLFIVRTVFSHGAVEICDMKNDIEFQVNGQCLKSFLESPPEEETSMGLLDPTYR